MKNIRIRDLRGLFIGGFGLFFVFGFLFVFRFISGNNLIVVGFWIFWVILDLVKEIEDVGIWEELSF